MSKVVLVGGSIIGLGTALALADHGHDVELFERSPDQPPSTVEASAVWRRQTVPQYLHSHAFASLGCNLLRDRAPDVYHGLLDSGATEVNLADRHPPTFTDFQRQPGDERLRMVLSRRSTFEMVLRQRTLARPNVTLSTGTTVRGLVTNGDGDRVRGVQLHDHQRRDADMVVDAGGRRTGAQSWLEAAGLTSREVNSESCRIVYYTRYYRLLSDTPPGPLNRGFGAGGLWDSYTAVLFLGDNRTFSISLGVLPEDSEMKALRNEDAFTAAIRATPLLAEWVTPGNSEPISPVYSMGGLNNSLQLPTGEEPPVKGFFSVGDSVCTTNPAYGRGVSLGLQQAYMLADLLDEYPEVDADQAREFAKRDEELVRPWWEEAVTNDRGRAELWRATLEGRSPQPPPEGVINFGMAAAAAGHDEAIWRRLINVMMMLKPPASLYDDDEMRQRIGKALAAGPPQLPGASRSDLLEAVRGSHGQAYAHHADIG